MATIQKREGIKGNTYRVLVRHKGHTVESRSFRRLADAKAFASKADTAINEGAGSTLREAKKRTLGEAIKRYVDSVIAARDDKSTVRHYAFWTERLGHMRLANITADVIAAARDDLAAKTTRLGKPMAPATVKSYLESLSAVFKACRKEYRWTQYNPVRDVTMPKLPKGRDRYLTDAERVRLLEECGKSPDPRLYPFVLLAVSTGARAAELTGLTWGDVDTARGIATLRDTKNGDMRALPIKGAALTAIKAMQPKDASPTLHVFAGPPGPIFDYAKPFNAARDAAEIKNFRFHDCRHSTASYLAMNGASASEIAAVLGHRTLQMVKRYAHLSDGHVGSVIEKMNEKIFGASTAPTPEAAPNGAP
jgi:integrase